MKIQLFRSLLFVIFICFGIIAEAQGYAWTETLTEKEEIDEPKDAFTSHGLITYDIPDDILSNLRAKPGSLKKTAPKPKRQYTPGINKRQGYRIQVFSDGRNPSTLQQRAKNRGKQIVARFPKYRGQVYTFSTSPNWYTRIGNFVSQKEAQDALAELKRAFPSFAGEMRVVKSQITIIK